MHCVVKLSRSDLLLFTLTWSFTLRKYRRELCVVELNGGDLEKLRKRAFKQCERTKGRKENACAAAANRQSSAVKLHIGELPYSAKSFSQLVI